MTSANANILCSMLPKEGILSAFRLGSSETQVLPGQETAYTVCQATAGSLMSDFNVEKEPTIGDRLD